MNKLLYWYLIKTNAEKESFRTQIMQQAGISKQTLYRYLKGEQMPTKTVMALLSETSGIPVKELYHEIITDAHRQKGVQNYL
jgi:transcriptional regulator with XRE-family HTH domain